MRFWTPLLRTLLPRTFYGRTLLIFALPLICISSISTYVFYVRHWDKVTSMLADHVVEGFVYRVRDLERARGSSLTLPQGSEINPSIKLTPSLCVQFYQDDPYLKDALTRAHFQEFSVQRVGESFHIQVCIPEGTLSAFVPYNRLYLRSTDIFLMWYAGSHVLFMGIAWLFMNNQIRPLKDLAKLAEALGKGRPYQGIRIRGAQEVRQVGLSFIGMRQRIERFVSERLDLLAAISHDLKTPLTRMRLALALFPQDKPVQDLLGDVDDMQSMIQSYLDFVKTQTPEKFQSVEINELLKSIVARYPQNVDLKKAKRFKVDLQILAFRRCMYNLLDNALKFGEHAFIEIRPLGDGLWLTVDDDGPGIPDEERAHVFKPFYQADASRNQNRPGTGLGLSIVRDVIQRHGGTVHLDLSPLGGLRVRVFLPKVQYHEPALS